MISVNEALKTVLNATENFGVEKIHFLEAVGRVLKEPIRADRDFPPFNRVSMDGVAIKTAAFLKGQRQFSIENIQPAGSSQLTLENDENCIEVMTGAILPKGCDAVIPYEKTRIEDQQAFLEVDELKFMQNVHLKGLDRKKNDLLIAENTFLSTAEIGVLATVGVDTVKVAKQPRVMIISTGDELVDVAESPMNYQIRRSNVYTLHSLLSQLKIQASVTHINDDKEILKNKIESYLKNFDVLMFSGAVSKGKFDFLPEVLDELGVQKKFHKVKQRPGKPFWFGKKAEKTVFAFPGNPVSTFISCLKYFHPWFWKSMGVRTVEKNAVLKSDFHFKPALTYFLQVKAEQKDGIIWAYPVTGKGSGDLANLIDADGFLELPEDRSSFVKGETFPLITYRN